MANALLNWALKQIDVKGPAKCVLIVLANRADKMTHECFPSVSQLMADCGLGHGTVCRAIDSLVDQHKIQREKRGTQTFIYTLQTGPERTADRSPADQFEPVQTGPTGPLWDATGPECKRKKKVSKKKENTEPPLTVRSTRPTKVPDDFSVSEEMRAWATAEGFNEQTVQEQTAAMVDHFRGSGKPKLDWVATWRNWLRNSRGRFNGNGQGQTKQDRNNQRARELLAAMYPEDRGGSERRTEQSHDGRVQRTTCPTLFGADPSDDKSHD